MNWNSFFWLATTFLLVASPPTSAQQTSNIFRIGYLSNADQASESARVEGIRLALHDLGYIEGKNIATEYRYAEGKRDRAPEIVAELVRLKVDVIVIDGGATWIRAAKNATKTIPIVMTGGAIDPVEAGFVDSLARPGGNITGLTSLDGELVGKRLELLKEAFPKITRVAAIYEPGNPSNPTNAVDLKDALPVAARSLRLTLQPLEVRKADDLEKAFAAISKQRPHGLYVGAGQLTLANQQRIIGFTLKSRLPSVYSSRVYVEAGGLMSYGADRTESYRRIAYYIDRILKGTKPADLPVEQPKKFEFIVNLKAAKQIALTIPPNLLVRADRVIR